MKKLTLALMSLMLFFGMGTAFADNTLPTPTFTPASGATVAPGGQIDFTFSADFEEQMEGFLMPVVFFLYVENDATTDLEADAMTLMMAAMGGMPGTGPLAEGGEDGEEPAEPAYKMGMYSPQYDGWMAPVTISETASGTVTLRVRMAAVNSDNDVEYSDEMSMSYTVEGEAVSIKPNAPTFSVAEGAVEQGVKVEIEFQPTSGVEVLYYIIDGSEADFTSITEYSALEVQTTLSEYEDLEGGIEITKSMTILAAVAKIDVVAKTFVWSDITTASYTIQGEDPEPAPAEKPAAPTFTVESGEVAFGTVMEIEAAAGTTVYYTTDGTEPTVESAQWGRWDEIMIVKAMTVKAIAVLDDVVSEVATVSYTVSPVEAVLTLTPMQDGMVGKNVAVDVAFSDGTPASADWVQAYPASVYYTVDGETVPSKAAYEAQEGDGAIKMVSVKWEDGYGPVQDGAGNLMPLTFGEATHLKAIGYLMDGDDVILTTSVLDTLLQVKEETNPTLSLPNGMMVKAGDTLVITNPNVWPAAPEYEDFESEEEWFEALDEYDALTASLPVTVMYYSFDGTLPTMANRFADKETENVFSTDQYMSENITVVFKEDEEGELYGYVPAIFGLFYDEELATVRFEDGKFSMQVLAVTTAVEEGGDDDWGGLLSASPKYGMPGAKPFQYGSDFVQIAYYNTPVTLTFNPESGSTVEEGTAVAIVADREVEIFYMMFDSEESAKAAEWNQEEAESYNTELMPRLTSEKNTVKAAYAYMGTESITGEFFYATYTVTSLPDIELTFDPASGSTVKAGTEVTVTASRETEIFYIVYASKEAADADETFMVNAKEVEEDGKPVITKEAAYLRCAVTDKGEMKYFDAVYTIDFTANEDEELAGVSVYPNPSNGVFNIELPVAATVEVFMSNGMLYQRLTLGEGNTELTINRSGIYFLRITGEGRTTVKRIIVR